MLIEIAMPMSQLEALLRDAAELGGRRALINAGLQKPYITKAEAYRMHRRIKVDRWIKEGRLKLVKDCQTSKGLIDVIQLESVAKANARPSYGLVTERRAS